MRSRLFRARVALKEQLTPVQGNDCFVAGLRMLGRVEQESRTNDEVTDPYVDLQARLKSARASEHRMLELLGTRTGKLEDVLDAERELAPIRGEIESMEGVVGSLILLLAYGPSTVLWLAVLLVPLWLISRRLRFHRRRSTDHESLSK